MALRKAGAYTHRYARPYTRKSKKKGKNYIRMFPPSKIVKMDMGDISGYNRGKYPITLRLVSKENVQIRDTALEASRQIVVKQLETNLPGQFCAHLKKHPHHVLREHAMLTGAGADRMSKGMSQSYGVSKGRAAMVKRGADIFTISVLNNDKAKRVARNTLLMIKPKLPNTCRIIEEATEMSTSAKDYAAKQEKVVETVAA